MMRFDRKRRKLERLPSSDLKENEILERSDLQQAIVNSWDEFRREIKGQDLYLIGQEIAPHDDVGDRIDILAYSAEENLPVIIELKRSRNKLQLLQSITYAAMISTWTSERLLAEARRQQVPDLEDLEDLLKETEVQSTSRIMLIAEQFEPEVMIASDWLYQQYKVDIMACGMHVFKSGDEIYFNLVQKYPLSELSDSYAMRGRTAKKSQTLDITWDEVAAALEYEWGPEAINVCREFKEGEPSRRRFGLIRTNWDGFNWISINFRRNYVNVYLKGNPENAEELIQGKFGNSVEIGTWRDGYSFLVKSKSQLDDLFKWLKLERSKAA